MPKTIKIDLSNDGINKAISELNKHKAEVDAKTKELAERLATLGRNIAASGYSGGKVTVTVVPTDNGFEIDANGEDVCFLEFGAGVSASASKNPLSAQMPFEVRPGSWSEQNARQFSEKGYWYYGGKKYESVPQRNAMYSAYRSIMDNVYIIAKEVFK